MKNRIDINSFIENFITKRSDSFLKDDLNLNRDKLYSEISGKSALVIGGAGTIGSNYITALLKFNLKKLVVIDTNENGLTELVRSVRSSNNHHHPSELITYPISFSENIFIKIFKHHGPFDIISNFAAHKHVRSEKDFFSVEAMISNNFLNAKKMLDIIIMNPPKHFFCVSTDKATDPENVMGASKLLMEKLIFSYKDKLNVKTARFANVAFSNGSLLSGFLNRLNNFEPLSCPLGVKRYFVSPKESGELCLIASILGNSGDIFFPNMKVNELVSFEDITKDFLNYLGMTIDYCRTEELARQKSSKLSNDLKKYPVYFFKSKTTGEKLFEEFFSKNDNPNFTMFKNLGVINNNILNKFPLEECYNDFVKLFSNLKSTKEDVIILLKKYLNNFSHAELGKNLDNQM